MNNEGGIDLATSREGALSMVVSSGYHKLNKGGEKDGIG